MTLRVKLLAEMYNDNDAPFVVSYFNLRKSRTDGCTSDSLLFFQLLDRFTFNEDLDDFSLCFRIKLLRLRGRSNFVVSYAHTITDNALIASESDWQFADNFLWCYLLFYP